MQLFNYDSNCYNNNYGMNTFNDLSDYGILTHKRTIFIFVNKNEYEANLCYNARFVLINECVYLGDKRGNITSIKIDNSTINRTSVYFGKVAFEIPNDISTGYFTVEIGINKEKQSLHNTNEVLDRDTSCVSESLLSCPEDVSSEIVYSFETCVIPPIYYNELHMIREFGDFGNFLVDVTDSTYNYSTITDNSTRYIVSDINCWDSMKAELYNRMNSCDKNVNPEEAINASDWLSSSFEHCLSQNSIFIYDSDAKGMNQPGVNVVGGYIPNGKYYPTNYSVSNLEKTLKLFQMACHNLENTYGHIRVMCCPNEIGNRNKMYFKDYTNGLPNSFVPINRDENGIPSAALDNGLFAEKDINDSIDLITDWNSYNNTPMH